MRRTFRSLIEPILQRVAESTKPPDANQQSIPSGDSSHCLLKAIGLVLDQTQATTSNERKLLDGLRTQIDSIVDMGFTIRTHLPLLTSNVQDDWLGKRWLFAHERLLTTSPRWASIVSSRIGRLGRQLDQWPSHMEGLCKALRAHDSILLTVSQTTTAPLIQPLIRRLGPELGLVHILVRPSQRHCYSLSDWLLPLLDSIGKLAPHRNAKSVETIHLSPLLCVESDHSSESAEQPLGSYPIQDRIAVCWGHRVCALQLRPGGTNAALLERRLSDSRYPLGTVSVLIPGVSVAWLDRGAVGWHQLPRVQIKHSVPSEFGCRGYWQHSSNPRVQWTCPYRLFAERNKGNYLVHCVRGQQGVLVGPAIDNLVIDAWLRGSAPEDSALATLINIFSSGRLRGGSVLTRGGQPCVSFSAVALGELIARREFQSHLGRWDWEPYGLLIDRAALEKAGARPVIYGDPSEYESMAVNDRQFFQPAHRRSPHRRSAGRPGPPSAHATHRNWQDESEWRLMGDLRLHDLPSRAVHAFVSLEHQAAALAQRIDWPVIWLQDDRIAQQPATPVRRRRSLARTSRN